MNHRYTELAHEVRAIKREYHSDIDALAAAVARLRGQALFALILAACGWGVLVVKLVVR